MTSLSAVKLALLANQLRSREEDLKVLDAAPIAIVGMACRLPGGVATLDEYWDLLTGRIDAIEAVPANRWSSSDYFDPDPAAPGKINTRFGGFLHDIERFDPLAFGIAPNEARYMDPQHRLLLEVAWEACGDAGRPLEGLRGSPTGIFFGVCGNDYARLQLNRPSTISAHTLSGTQASIAAGRLSYLFDLRGPSMVIDTACSSSLVAIHLAVKSLRNWETDLAVAGGVNLNLTPEGTISLAKWGMLAPDGRCKTFDSRADGFVRSEGCGAVVLKRLSDALRDGDRVHAVIRGSAVNQDGRSNVLTAPNGEAQRDVIRAALAQARIAASDISYVETHGTGTKVGDPIEVEALADTVGRRPQDAGACYLGAVKANLGHLEAAAGVAGLIKAALCLTHRTIPPQIHYRELNPLISLDGTALRIPTEMTPWETNGGTRFAGLSSFGFSGTNAHLILEEAPQLPARPLRADRAQLLPVSSKTAEGLRESLDRYASFLGRADLPELADVCFTAGARRRHYTHRRAYVGGSADELRAALRSAPDDTGEPAGQRPEVVFAYSGQGGAWSGMARGLQRDEPICARVFAECDERLQRIAGWSLQDTLETDAWTSDTERYQAALFVIQAALTALWRSWGIEPAAVVGHSVGEIAAAHAAGALNLDQALELVVGRGRLMQRAAGAGAMAVAAVGLEEAEAILSGFGDDLVVAAHNGPASLTVSGTPAAVQSFMDDPRLAGRFVRRLDVSCAFHSPQMDSAAAELAARFGASKPARAREGVAIFSSVTGGPVSADALTADYWRRNLRDRVRFADAIGAALAAGRRWFVEIGPQPGLIADICAAAEGIVALPSLRRDRDDRTVMLESLAELYAGGAAVHWAAVGDAGSRCVSLPTYAWQRERYWIDIDPEERQTLSEPGIAPLLGRRIESAFADAVVFETLLSPRSPGWLTDHRLAGTAVVPAAALIEMALSAAARVLGHAAGIELRDVVIERALVLAEQGKRRVQIGVAGSGDERTLRIASKEAGAEVAGDWVTHFRCRLSGEVSGDRLPAAAAGSGESVEPAGVYERFAARRIEFGPQFRLVESLVLRSAQTVAALAPGDDASARGYLVYPPRLDACFHALEPLFAAGTDAWLPVSVARVTLLRPGGHIAACSVRRRDDSSGGDLRADLSILDEEGAASVELEDFRLKRVSSRTLERLTPRLVDESLYEWAWESSVPEDGAVPAGPWLVVGDAGGLAEAFARSLREAGAECALVSPEQLLAQSAADRPPCRRVAFIAPLSAERNAVLDPLDAQQRIARPALQILQSFDDDAVDALWLVSRGAQRFATEAGAAHGTLWGLGAVVSHEYPHLDCRLIDLDPGDDAELQAECLLREARSIERVENRISWSDGERLAARLRRGAPDSPAAGRREPNWSLRGPVSGLLDDLAPAETAVPVPAAGEVLVEPRAVGLNFRDVLNVLGMLGVRAPALGAECAGRVIAAGPGVDPAIVGRDVMAFSPGCFGAKVAIPVPLVAALPPRLGAVEAAGIPVVFLTAKYGLERLAKLAAGQRILIHAGTGGVGLAALQIARKAGAVVYATAGSERKREYLRALGVEHVFSSRTPDFKECILELTGGAGVDVVLNSLSDELIAASFDVLGRNGRFVELGKRGIWSPEAVAAARPDVEYLPFDLSEVAVEQPELIAELFAELLAELADGRCTPLPSRGYRLDELRDAFDYMTRARHIGKLVVRLPVASPAPIVAGATYLITGAAGGLAAAAAKALTEHGATHLALLGRREPVASLQQLMTELRGAGVDVRYWQADVADWHSIDAAIGSIETEMPALRGVFHLAGVIDDAPIVTQTWERFERVLAPKVTGAWNLQRRTLDSRLDLFVLYSSLAAVTGWPGQGAYASGNGYLDAFARYRAARGLPALSINWGPWSEVGMAAKTAAAKGVDFAAFGADFYTPADGRRALSRLLGSQKSQAIAARIAPERLPPGSLTRLLSAERRPSGENGAAARAPRHDALDEIRSAPAARRRSLLKSHVEQEAARALGLKHGFRFEATRPLNDLGLDSLLAVQLANALSASFAHSFAATLLFDYPTIDELCGKIEATVLTDGAEHETDSFKEDPDLSVSELERLSDADAESLLLRELDGLGSSDR
jgi:acyl transferase domain-containing protein/NADPH:quinone reductase-like Zn-dependent oxidoreductase/acyl carrier protein